MAFGFASPFVITSGQESHPNQVYGVPAAGRHGESATGMRMDRRRIRLVGEVRRADIDSELAREMLYDAFNPTLEGLLVSENPFTGVRREIDCRLEELPVIEWSHQKRCLVFEIVLVALSPFWRGRPLTVAIAETTRKWSYPMSFPQRGSALPEHMIFGIRRQTLETRFENAGNVASGFTATFLARGGTVTNPSIRDEQSGAQIRLNYTMQQHDSITIENYLHKKAITINGENGFRFLDADGTSFFLVRVGRNRIGYRADTNISNLEVHVRYTPEYTYVGGREESNVPLMRSPYLAENANTAELVQNEGTQRLSVRMVPRV